jgi:hypothetical protein
MTDRDQYITYLENQLKEKGGGAESNGKIDAV